MSEVDVVMAFAEEGYQISPDALRIIGSHGYPPGIVEHTLANVDESVFVIDVEHIDVDGFLAENDKRPDASCICQSVPSMKAYPEPLPDECVDVLFDITDQSTCVGEYMEFVQYFRNIQ